MSIELPANEWKWRKAYPEKTQLETIETVMGFFYVHEEGIINQSYNSASDEADEEGRGDDFPGPYRWLLQQQVLDFNGEEAEEFDDLTPLEVLQKVLHLELRVKPDADLSPLGKLTQLEGLVLIGEENADYGFLEHLPNLVTLTLSGSGGRNLDSLKHLKNLKELVSRSVLRDLSPLTGLKQLEELQVDGSRIDSLEPLRGLTNLKLLFARNNRIQDVSPLSGKPNLNRLWLQNNCITDFSPLDQLPKMRDEDRADLRASRQLNSSHPPMKAIFKEWHNLELWAEYARWLVEQDDVLGLELAEKLEGEWNQLPLHWARPIQYEEEKKEDGQW